MLCAVQGVAAQAEVGQATRLVGSQQHVSNAHVPVLDTMPEATNQQESEDKWRGGGESKEGEEQRGGQRGERGASTGLLLCRWSFLPVQVCKSRGDFKGCRDDPSCIHALFLPMQSLLE